MAFCDLKPVRVFDENSGSTYIIGDVFAVYSFGADKPLVYSWDMLTGVVVTRRSITLSTNNFDYKIDNKLFTVSDDYFRALAIIESLQKKYDFPYTHEPRLFPPKNLYIETSAGKDAYFGEGEIDENDAAATFIMLMNFKLIKVLWLLALFIMLVIFGILHLTIGVNRDNLLYFIPISFACGGIVTLVVYMICHAAAKSKFRRIADSDPATGEVLTFVVSPNGFAACESSIYDGMDLVPWSEMDYFIESDRMFIIYKGKQAAAYIPKKAFEKKYLGGIADIIALKLEQK
ncbi:MAG: YcxB family protein [Oscillospiraceae bacterium]